MKILSSSESLAQAESNQVQNSKIVRFTFFAIFNCSKNGSSDSHQNWRRSSTDHVVKKLCNSSLEYHTNEFAKKHAKMDLRLYLRKGLTN